MKNKQRFLAALVSILSVLVLSVGGYFIWKANHDNTSTEAPSIDNSKYYSIRSNATELQKDLYAQLETAIDAKESDTKIAGLVAENFVADFYTWTNKVRITDIGGIQFVDETLRTNVYHQAKETFYVALTDYLDAGTKDKTLEVSEITVDSVRAQDYIRLGDEDEDGVRPETIVDSIVVELSWKYVDTTTINTQDYDTAAKVVLLKGEDGLYYVVEVNYVESEA